jgi:cytochrome P450
MTCDTSQHAQSARHCLYKVAGAANTWELRCSKGAHAVRPQCPNALIFWRYGLQACFREALRLYPVVPITFREAGEVVQVGGYKVPKGTIMHVNVYGMHRSPDYWDDPSAFKPERFLDDPDLAHSRAYLPFGAGPHNCVGYAHCHHYCSDTTAVSSSVIARCACLTDISFMADAYR